ncbi:unnamed protein product [Lathyrus oleraceus]|uniref:SANT domain-containing protein n=1 Tax=Pisum sativum TaxID=3888 RepID=A0A9D4Y5D0_PEA|nr:uncharacterized protein LOC127128031 [Pisum sativum]KAI5430860.1 hypothetical protein KIW84_035117 [Pisum sativum]
MASFEENDNDVFMGHHELSPRIGPDHQVDIPCVIKNSNQLSGSDYVNDKSLFSDIGLPVSIIWSDADTQSLVLGLFIFGKNFIRIKGFLENKGMGEILSFYYGKFYKTDGYRRWSECRKLKGRKCMIGKKLFSGPRQRELLSRLIPHVSEESQDTLLQVSKSYVEGRISLEEYISSLRSTVGLGVLVDAVGIGKEKGDLTRFGVESGKNNRTLSAQTCKDLSSLGPGDIIQSLTGGFRLSKTRSIELFWEAIWPRLLARGWQSELPKNRGYVTSKDYLVFLIPGVDKFSRRKLVKGDHYFDSVSDVLSKVIAEPNILLLKEEEEAKVGSCSKEELEKGSHEDDLSDNHRQCYLKPRSSTYSKDHIKSMFTDTSLELGRKPSGLRELKSVPDNSVCKVEVDASGKTFKGKKYMRKVKHSKDMFKTINQNSTKLTVIDTNRLSEGKLLKLKVKPLKHPPVEIEDSSMMTSSLLRESKRGSSTPEIVDTKMLICGKRKIIKTDSSRVVLNSGATSKNEAYDNPDNYANKVVKSQKNQHAFVFDDNGMKRIIKNQFNRRVGPSDSNHTAVPIKRRRLSACAKAEKSRINENSSEKLGFYHSSSFCKTKKNVCEPVSHQHNGSTTVSFADRSVEENNEKNILHESYQRTSVSRVKVEKCESFTFNISQVPSKSENSIMMAKAEEDEQGLKTKDPCLTSAATQEVVEEPLRTLCEVDSLEQQADINPRRQSTRNRPLTVRALECIANEFLHVQKRQKKKDIRTRGDAFNPCRNARTSGKTVLHRHCPDHGNAVSVQEKKHLIEDASVS